MLQMQGIYCQLAHYCYVLADMAEGRLHTWFTKQGDTFMDAVDIIGRVL